MLWLTTLSQPPSSIPTRRWSLSGSIPISLWTDRAGKTHAKAEVLPSLSSLARGADDDVQTVNASQVVLIRGTYSLPPQKASVRFVRIWVKRPETWQLLIYQETNKAEKNPEERSGFGAPSSGAPLTCENPCKTISYKIDNPAEQEVASMWQAVERTVLTNDVKAWIPNFTDNFLFCNPGWRHTAQQGRPRGHDQRTPAHQHDTDPAEVTSMRIWLFGKTAVMRSEHKPVHGKVLHVTRLLEKHNGRWQIAFGQRTWVE